MYWILGIALGIIVGYMLDREIYFYEGVHLGPRLQTWLYDRWARKYDAGKRESQLRDNEMLARPLLDALHTAQRPLSHREHVDSEKSSKLSAISVANRYQPFILDFATGTGRLSFALSNQPDFTGHIIALDLSQGMLEQAAIKLAGKLAGRVDAEGVVSRPEARIELLRHSSLPLPFADNTFDVVCALEVLELFPSMDDPLKEMTRVLRPGGVLLTSRGTEESGRKARVKGRAVFQSLLERHGLIEVEIVKWWKYFDRVTAVKRGAAEPAGSKSLEQVLQCRTCSQLDWQMEPDTWTCRHCGERLHITASGIVLN